MWYVIYATDVDNSLAARKQAQPAHRERLKQLTDQGRLLVAGPMPVIDSEDPRPSGFSGSTIIAEFDSLDAAKLWASQDPYVDAGVYKHVEIKPFIRALP